MLPVPSGHNTVLVSMLALRDHQILLTNAENGRLNSQRSGLLMEEPKGRSGVLAAGDCATRDCRERIPLLLHCLYLPRPHQQANYLPDSHANGRIWCKEEAITIVSFIGCYLQRC